jgi:hypothetical protein
MGGDYWDTVQDISHARQYCLRSHMELALFLWKKHTQSFLRLGYWNGPISHRYYDFICFGVLLDFRKFPFRNKSEVVQAGWFQLADISASDFTAIHIRFFFECGSA